MADAFICDGIRTPIGRYGGSLSSIRADDLAASVVDQIIKKNIKLDPEEIDEVMFGCANQAGEDNRNVARMASLLAGLPVSVPGSTINRLCGSGLDAVITACRAINSGEMNLIIAGGVENMSRAPFVMPKAENSFSRINKIEDTTIGWRFINKKLQSIYGTDAMPETAENVAEKFQVTREEQDKFSLDSQNKAIKAQSENKFKDEITNFKIKSKNTEIDFNKDEHPREGINIESLKRLKPVFKKEGTVTAGNASGINDGAAAVTLMSEEEVVKRKLQKLVSIKS